MMKFGRYVLSVICFLGGIVASSAQISAPGAAGQGITSYTNGAINDPIFVFCNPDNIGNPVVSSLLATPNGGTGPFNYIWYRFAPATNAWNTYNTQNGLAGPSTITNLTDGGYRVSIIDANGTVLGCYRCWVWNKTTQVSVAAIAAGCTPFSLSGNFSTVDTYTYYNPPADPFLISNTTSITVCFNATHTYVSDIGFYLVGPATCGSPRVDLLPHPQAIAAANGCCCNSGNNVTNLCLTTTPSGNISPCVAAVPLTGTFSGFTSATTAPVTINWAPIFGCDAASGGWRVQIYDCIGADVGALTSSTITFSGQSSCGPSTVVYNSGPINSIIADNSCTPATASIYTVPNPTAQAITYTATTNYSWIGTNVTGGTTLTPNVTPCPTVDTWYYLNVTNSVGCTHKDSAFFDYQVPNAPVITPAGPFCIDATPVNLVSDQPAGTWTGNGITDGVNGTFDPSLAGAGTHTITFTSPPPCGSPSTTTITVNALPLLSETHTDVTCFGFADGTVNLSVASIINPTTYAWVPGGNSTQDIANKVPGTYTVTVRDGNLCVNTLSVTIAGPLAALNASETHMDVSCGGLSDGSIDITTTGGTSVTPYLFNWTPNGSTAEDLTGISAASYSLTVTDNNGCIFNLPVNVSEPPQLVLTETHQDVPCFGLSNGSIDVGIAGGTGPFTYLWTNNAVTQDLNGIPAGNYSLTVTDINGCSATISVNIAEPLAALSATETHIDATCFTFCDGSIDISTSGGTAPYNYSWSNNANTEDITGLCAGGYNLVINDDNACPFNMSIQIGEPPTGISIAGVATDALCNGGADGAIDITASGGSGSFYSYAWSGGLGTVEDPIGLIAGVYTVAVTDATGVCTFTNSFTVGEPLPVVVSASQPETICIGGTTALTANPSGGTPGGYSVNWTSSPNDASLLTPTSLNPSISPVAVTTYTVTATDVNGCNSVSSANVTISLEQPLTITASTNPDTICFGESASYSFLATGGDGIFTYTLDNTTQVISPQTVSPTTTTTYSISVTDGCTTPSANTSVTIVVNPLPLISITANPNNDCVPLRVTFADASVPAGILWNWNFGDAGSTDNTSSQPTPSHIYEIAGSYDVRLTVTTADLCTDSAVFPAFVNVYPNPIAGFVGSPSTVTIVEPTVTFVDQSTGATQWLYDFLDGSFSTEQNPLHVYNDTGYFNVMQTVSTDYGCSDVAYNRIRVNPVFSLYVPSAFTPNDNDKNERFSAKGMGYLLDSYEMWVFNRWGQEVWRSKSIENTWDGKFENVECQAGVYLYKVKLRSAEDFREKYFQGFVTLVR